MRCASPKVFVASACLIALVFLSHVALSESINLVILQQILKAAGSFHDIKIADFDSLVRDIDIDEKRRRCKDC